jgi:hypothetical protein
MSTPTGAEANRYEPFGNSASRLRKDERAAQSERQVPEAVAPVIFRNADQNDLSG